MQFLTPSNMKYKLKLLFLIFLKNVVASLLTKLIIYWM